MEGHIFGGGGKQRGKGCAFRKGGGMSLILLGGGVGEGGWEECIEEVEGHGGQCTSRGRG